MLKDILEIIRDEIINTGESCSKNSVETALHSTSDKYLNNLSTLVKQVEENYNFVDEIKSNLFQLPSEKPWLASSESYKNHEKMTNRLNEFYSAYSEVLQSIQNEPLFE